jgi:TPR repeat protein
MECQVTTLKVLEQSELVLAIYEVGQSFYQGWGVPKDKKMGVVRLLALQKNYTYQFQSYFQVAANLGDPDAQQSLAFCLAHGKGCKKDRREAAKWYRAAVCSSSSLEGYV